MKLRRVITGLIAMLVAANLQATTLKLSSDIDLLVLDGHKISGSLLKGAEGLELERGEHQLLFRLEKSFKHLPQPDYSWVSTPQIVTFTARSQSVLIKLPPLLTLSDGQQFDKNPQFILVDEHGNEVASKRDRLRKLSQNNFEQAMVHYNLDGQVASMPGFARLLRSPAQSSLALPDMASSQGQHPAERLLRLWYLQVDAATRQRLLLLMNALHTS